MSMVIIDADDLAEFAAQLSTFSRDLRGQQSKLRAQFHKLGETWRDPQYAKFAQEFEQTMRNLERFAGTADEVVPRLKATAGRARDVHR